MKKINRQNEIAYLEITTWRGHSFNAEHYYGNVRFEGHEERMTYPLTQEQADKLNEKDSAIGAGCYEAGEPINRYDTTEQLEKDAADYFHKVLINKGAKLLCVGNSCHMQPFPVIAYADGYKEIADKFTELYKKGEFCDWDFAKREDEKILDKISREWKTYLKD